MSIDNLIPADHIKKYGDLIVALLGLQEVYIETENGVIDDPIFMEPSGEVAVFLQDGVGKERITITPGGFPFFRYVYKGVAGDPVHKPKHYEVLEGVEAVQVIASSMTQEQWHGYCLGNIIKYRLRAGKKEALQQDIDKANEYEALYQKHLHRCEG